MIELLVVVAIIAILAAIAMPNFLAAEVRAKVARTQNDMRTLVLALEMYQVDNQKPPTRSDPPGVVYAHQPDVPDCYYVPDFDKQGQEMGVLTTPVAYLTSLPIDIFAHPPAGRRYLIDYFDPLHTWGFLDQSPHKNSPSDPHRDLISKQDWMLLSVGPDGYLGGARSLLNYPHEPLPVQYSWGDSYDPSNGTATVPGGNIIWLRDKSSPDAIYHDRGL